MQSSWDLTLPAAYYSMGKHNFDSALYGRCLREDLLVSVFIYVE
jgi:hypothetical protein